jgi:hypothetical protein
LVIDGCAEERQIERDHMELFQRSRLQRSGAELRRMYSSSYVNQKILGEAEGLKRLKKR